MVVGCKDVNRAEWTDPKYALEVAYAKQGDKGVGVAFEFNSPEDATKWWKLFLSQLAACKGSDNPRVTTAEATDSHYVGTRTYPGGLPWTEAGLKNGSAIKMWIASDPQGALTPEQIKKFLASAK